MKYFLTQNFTIAGLGLTWIIFVSVAVFSYWSWIQCDTEPNPMLVIAIGNSIGVVLLSSFGFPVVKWIFKSEKTAEALDIAETKRWQATLLNLHEELETRIAERTAALKYANHELVAEIVERKQIEIALRKSESLYRNLVETIPHGIEEIDTRGIIIFANSALHRILGYRDSELLGKTILDLLPESVKLDVSNYLAMVLQEEPSLTYYQAKAWQKDGQIIDIQVDWNYKRNEEGEVTGFIAVVTDITQRKLAEAALKESQHLIQQIADTIPALLYIYDPVNKCKVYVNRQTEIFFGYSKSEILAKSCGFCHDFLHPEDISINRQLLEKLLQAKDGDVIEGEYRVKNAQGEWRWLQSREVVFKRNYEGVPEQIIGTATDITERKQLAAELAATEELYRTMTRNFPNGTVVLFDPDLRYTLVEGRGLTEVGLSNDYLMGKTIWEALEPELVRTIEAYYRAALAGEPSVFELTYGEKVYLIYVLPLTNEQGEVYGGMSMSQNISDRKRAELALLEERNFVSGILDTTNALILVLDCHGKIVRFNLACEQLTGYTFPEVKDKYFWDLFLISEELAPVKSAFQALQNGELHNEYEDYWIVRDGTVKLISWSNTVLLDPDGSIKYIIATGIDITERRRTEEIRQKLEQEQALSQLRLRFFTLASHEFRTPLTTVLGSAQILLLFAHEWSKEQIEKSVSRIELAAQRMRQLIDDILLINRAETGKLEFNPKLLDIQEFSHNILEDLQVIVGEKYQIKFISNIENKLGFFDRELIGFTINNLLNNAIKYSPEEQEVYLTLTSTSTGIIFTVRDLGIGIPATDIPQIFEAFHRGTNVDFIPGSGLGLTVVKNCVEVQGGSISVTSEVGVGTTFTVIIPDAKREM